MLAGPCPRGHAASLSLWFLGHGWFSCSVADLTGCCVIGPRILRGPGLLAFMDVVASGLQGAGSLTSHPLLAQMVTPSVVLMTCSASRSLCWLGFYGFVDVIQRALDLHVPLSVEVLAAGDLEPVTAPVVEMCVGSFT